MPIRPENKKRYPANWKYLREVVLARAGGSCEWCHAINHTEHPETGSMVVLTIAHLDHNPEHNELYNLRALCQRCHNRYDAPVRAAGRRARRMERLRQVFDRGG